MSDNEIMYTRSNGEKIPLKSMNTEHIINSWTKELREVFNSKNFDETKEHLDKIDMLKEEYFKRLNDFRSKLGG